MAPRKRSVRRNQSGKLAVADVAKETGVHVATVYRWLKSGDLPSSEVNGVKVVSRAALKRFIRDFL